MAYQYRQYLIKNMNLITQKTIRGFQIQKSHELFFVLSPLLNYPVADSTLSTIVIHTHLIQSLAIG